MPVFLLFTYYSVFKSTYFSHIIVRVFRRYMAEILPIRNKTLFNQSINVRVLLCNEWFYIGKTLLK